jgi:hypothetical protein
VNLKRSQKRLSARDELADKHLKPVAFDARDLGPTKLSDHLAERATNLLEILSKIRLFVDMTLFNELDQLDELFS